jgi:hypothetical protein
MDRFNFLMVLMSIIIGLGVTELLVNVARQIKHRKSGKAFWVHSGVVVLLFLAFLQVWWESWQLRVVDEWAFPYLLLMLATPVGLFLISHLIFPDDFENADFEVYYFENTRLLWPAGAVTVLAALIFQPIAFGGEFISADNAPSLSMIGFFIILTVFRARALHLAAIPILILALLIDVMVFRPIL